MAFASVGTGGTTANTANNQASSSHTVATNNLTAGRFGVLLIAVQNSATGDGDQSAVSNVQDASGNTWTKGIEFQNGQGTAQTGSVCSLWYCTATTNLNTGSTITWDFTANTSHRDESVSSLWIFTVAGTVSVDGTPAGLAADAADAASLNVTTSGGAALRIRGIGAELNSATQMTATDGSWTLFTNNRSATTAAAQAIYGEFKISTASGDASNPTLPATCDNASVYIAFKETAPTDTPKAVTANVNVTVTVGRAVAYTKTVSAGVNETVTVGRVSALSQAVSAGVSALASVGTSFLAATYEALAGVYGSIMGASIFGTSIAGAISYVTSVNTPQSISASVTALVTVTKAVGKEVEALVSALVTVTRAVAKAVQPLVSVLVTARKAVDHINTDALVSAGATVTKNVGKIITAALVSLTATVDPTFTILRAVSASITAAVTMRRDVSKEIEALVSVLVSATKAVAKTIAATLVSVGATITKNVGKGITALVSVLVSIITGVGYTKAVTALVSAGATVVRAVGKAVKPLVSVGATVLKAVGKLVTALVSVSATVTKNVGKLVTAFVSLLASVIAATAALYNQSVTAFVSVGVTSSRVVAKEVEALVSLTAIITKAVATRVTAFVSLLGSVTAQAIQVFLQSVTALVSTTVTVQKDVGKIVAALVSALVSVAIQSGLVVEQAITAYVSVAVSRFHLFVCYVEQAMGWADQAEEVDPWSAADEQPVGFVDEAEGADPWATVEEQEDQSEEAQQEPEPACCDD